MTGALARAWAGLGLAVTMFSVLPFPTGSGRADGAEADGTGGSGDPGSSGSASSDPASSGSAPSGSAPFDRRTVAAALAWLPCVGVLLGAIAAVPAGVIGSVAGVGGIGSSDAQPVADPLTALLGAALAIGLLAWLTRALHLDGLADTVDGLGSAAPPAKALEIMRKSDIGPFGVVALLIVVTLDIIALAVASGDGVRSGVLGLLLACAVGRVGVVLAAGPRVPSARPNGFGALVAGVATGPVRVLGVATAVAVAAIPLLMGDPADAARLGVAGAAGLVVAIGWRWKVVRRLGGTTGDVFGSVIEVGQCATLVALALAVVAT